MKIQLHKHYRPFLPSLLLAVLLAACSSKEPAKEENTITEKDKESLRYLKEVEWPKAYREQDTVLLDRILGDDFKMIDDEGNGSDKKAEMDWIKNNKWSRDSFYFEIKRFDILENGTAIVAGTGHIVEDSSETIYQSSNILVKRNGQWKAVASHVSGSKKIK
jgi:hypothetical protein